MKPIKTLIICESYHHENTLKIAKVIAEELNAQIKKSCEVKNEEFYKYDLIGFGSGIYDDMHHKSLLNLVNKLPRMNKKRAFIFSTSGVPVAILGNRFLLNYSKKAHETLKTKLKDRGFDVIGEFICPGFNTNVFLKYFGGLNKQRPNDNDLKNAKEFASKMLGS